MKVLLINPPAKAPNPVMPLGLGYIAAALENEGIPVKVIDAWAERHSFDSLGKEVAKQCCDIIGITMMSPLYAAGMKTVDIVKQNSDALLLVGGPHPSALPEQCLNDNKNIDFVVIGEGEKVLVKLVRALEYGNKDPVSIKGLAYRKNGRIINTGTADIVENLDDLPFPARHLFPLQKYKTHPPYGKKNPYLTLMSSRGCPFGCTYCSKSVFGSKYRVMNPERICEEINFLISKYRTREVHFYDDTFTIDINRTEALCEKMISEEIKIDWSCTTRVDLINAKILHQMKKAGCWLISYGVESGNPGILKNVRKGYTLKQAEDAFRLTKKAGIRTIGYFMLGLPGETDRTISETVNISLKLKPDFVSWGITSLYPGSALYREAQSGKLGEICYTQKNKDWHSSGSPYGDGFSIIYQGKYTREELESYAKQANRLFYLRITYLLKFLFKIRSWYEFTYYLKSGFQLLGWMFRRNQ